ncbi:M23 family metallopeptidase [Kumtagia ephedrae]|nr:M23 family metallopeptidase [Mesorhizobium ephedrae]
MRFACLVAILIAAVPASAQELGLPADCTPGKDCFVQQFMDMQEGGGIADPFCGNAAYDGHEGTDLRVLSMADVERGVPVVAMADGTVLRGRDGEPDHLVVTDQDRAAVADKECGNGMVVDHGGGLEVQYCHMRRGSLVVAPGDTVNRGQKLGEIGASGMAAFPHVHVTVRRDGTVVEPMTGRRPGQGCLKEPGQAAPLFAADVAAALGGGRPQLLAMGLAGEPLDHAALPVSGPPPAATAASPNLVGWGWLINLRAGDRIRLVVTGPDGATFAETMTERMDRPKAAYSSFAGKRGAPAPGRYDLKVEVWGNAGAILRKSGSFTVE